MNLREKGKGRNTPHERGYETGMDVGTILSSA